jgi:outer membrane protein assembly factor BamB
MQETRDQSQQCTRRFGSRCAPTVRAWLFVLALVPLGRGVETARAPYPDDALTPIYRAAAEHILNATEDARGNCIVFGAGTGRLAWRLAESQRFRVLGVEENSEAVMAGRKALHAADLYGTQITLQAGTLTNLRYRDYAAAVVVSDAIITDGRCPGSAAEMFRMVRPDGGIALIGQPPNCPKRLPRKHLESWLRDGGLTYQITDDARGIWARVERGPLPGAGEWTHNLADIGNTACSGDTRTSSTVVPLWFGTPGPAVMTDRHWRPQAPLYKNGRLFVAGDDRIICTDAYNGARLWERNVPNSSRIAMMRDAGFLALAPDSLYVAVGARCLKLDVVTGQTTAEFTVPAKDREWGYIATDGNDLFGSAQKVGASYTAARTGRGAVGNQLGRGNDRSVITSTSLFCLDRQTGKLRWTYDGKSAIANAAICADQERLYFIESVAPQAMSGTAGRVKLPAFTDGPGEHITCLDRKTGTVVWRHQRDLLLQHVVHLSCSQGVVLANGCRSHNKDFWYHLRAYKAADGQPMWEQDVPSGFGTRDTDHGKQDKHAMIIGNAVYLKQGNFDLRTGKPLGYRFPTSNCAECSSSLKHIFSRNGGSPSAFALNGKGTGKMLCSVMRPGCYISIIPAGGIVMMPALSAGCTCGYALQTSIGWLPQ